MNRIKLFFISLTVIMATGCKDVFEPELENLRDITDTYDEPRFAQGLLINGYVRIPANGWSFNDMATDDAVSSNETNQYYRMSTGEWASNFNPVNPWSNAFTGIQYMNMVLSITDSVVYSRNEVTNQMFRDRAKGEAYGLRALFLYHLLQAHGGVSGGELLGVPVFTEPQGLETNFNQPRATFQSCMTQLYGDVEKAIALLPNDYINIASANQVPAKYKEMGANQNDYNRAFGDDAKQLLSGRIAKAIRAQAALLAASPAFNQGSGTTWAQAADYASQVIDLNGGVNGLPATGVTWYANKSEVDGAGGGNNPPEILWRGSIDGTSTALEEDHFPPTLFGRGLLNPTQNLVEAFPMANGYPISNSLGGYLASSPYTGRDPRLTEFIIYNGATAGVGNTAILTAADGGTNDGLDKVETSTRTGYYMKKLLRQDVNLNSTSKNGQRHIKPRMRYTEFYLAYAEAANEAWGPTNPGTHAYSAYDVIKAIRKRAKIGLNNGDAYLESIKGDKDAMRQLIRNERRLELCFEGYRFWDLRRWKENLREAAKGVKIQAGIFNPITVDNRVYADHMIYGPVPDSEILKFSALKQNTGW